MTLVTNLPDRLEENPVDRMTGDNVQRLLGRLCDWNAGVVFFPVRHHSPIGAALVTALIERVRPATVLIEGPSDFNQYLDELLLDHELPIAIYSYFRTEEGKNSGAYYPFCEYSPEWAAFQTATRQGADVRFIDLPWTKIATNGSTHRYADAELRRGRYVKWLCDRLHVEDFDDLWDKLIESHEQMDLGTYLARVHALCFHIREWEESIDASDRRREAFMAEQIRLAQAASPGRIMVVTGGFHSSALAARLEDFACPGLDLPESDGATEPTEHPVVGIALTTYSYERLDNQTGYNAGMPSPGFYEHAWRQRCSGERFSHQPLLTELVNQLRERRQTLSTADLIAVETSARALAAMRGRPHVWRRDLVDAVTSALIKDEIEYGCESPFVAAVQAVLRGGRRGRLAAGTRRPPLVLDIQEQLTSSGLELTRGSGKQVALDLLQAPDLLTSRLLHRLRLLGIAGIGKTDGTDFLRRDDLTRLWEEWQLRWSPEFESSCIEAARYGTSLADAASARLEELAREHSSSAAAAAVLLLESAQAGIETLSETLLAELNDLIEREAQFGELTDAVGHLVFLYCFDEAFGAARNQELGKLLRLAFERSVWLLELIGRTITNSRQTLSGMGVLLETFRRAAKTLGIDADELVAVLARVEQDSNKPPSVRGAAAGILWTLGVANSERVLADLLLFTEPNDLGDFLAGLFALAREVIQRHPQLVQSIDRLLLEFSAEDFQQALPSMRLAFTYFTPREKHYMLTTLFESLGIKQAPRLADATVDEATAAAALAIEERVFEAIAKYDLGDEP